MTATLFDPGPRIPDHPAKYPPHILHVCADLLPADRYPLVFDPFAGVGGIHALPNLTVGVEIEPEWARQHPGTIVADATCLPFADGTFDAICTSPTYGNRMADHHEARDGSVRHSYRHVLGRTLHVNNTGQCHWHAGHRGDAYRTLHEKAWREAIRVLKPGGRFVLNVKDFYAGGERQHPTGWHLATLEQLGLRSAEQRDVPCGGIRHGANGTRRVPVESVAAFDKEVSR